MANDYIGQHHIPSGQKSETPNGQRSTHLPGTVVGQHTGGGQVANRDPRPQKESSYVPIEPKHVPTRTGA
jgi:hypothetical protein